jgi:hypothetical protein
LKVNVQLTHEDKMLQGEVYCGTCYPADNGLPSVVLDHFWNPTLQLPLAEAIL